ncbi:MAG: C1 family peptidase, partial [Candidatus Aenigmatarchaeota archaeon]
MKDQGPLGSCVAFSTAALKEWQEWQEFLKEKKHFVEHNLYNDLSEQWIYHKTKEIDNIPGQGTTIRAALYILKKYGVPPEKSWLYNPYRKGQPKENAEDYAEYAKIDDFFR